MTKNITEKAKENPIRKTKCGKQSNKFQPNYSTEKKAQLVKHQQCEVVKGETEKVE